MSLGCAVEGLRLGLGVSDASILFTLGSRLQLTLLIAGATRGSGEDGFRV